MMMRLVMYGFRVLSRPLEYRIQSRFSTYPGYSPQEMIIPDSYLQFHNYLQILIFKLHVTLQHIEIVIFQT